LKRTSVIPIVKVDGVAGIASTTGASPSAGFGACAALGGGYVTTTTENPFISSNGFKKSTRSCEAFFSTTAHLTPSKSSNS
jgi:hypothetical protein